MTPLRAYFGKPSFFLGYFGLLWGRFVTSILYIKDGFTITTTLGREKELSVTVHNS